MKTEMKAPQAGASRLISRHWQLVGVGALLLVPAAIFVLAYFQPQKLFIDKRVDEAAPAGAAAPKAVASGSLAEVASPGRGAPDAPSNPRVVARAPLRSLEHATTGEAIIVELAGGSRVLRLEGFRTSNGPELRVYLSAGSSDAAFGREYGRDFVDLGALKGNIGSQNYDVPSGVDLARYSNAVIWCRRFGVGFGVATLR